MTRFDFRIRIIGNERKNDPGAIEDNPGSQDRFSGYRTNSGALYKFALKNNLGYPQTDEYEFQVGVDTYVGQVYNLGIVYVKKGDWANVKSVKKP